MPKAGYVEDAAPQATTAPDATAAPKQTQQRQPPPGKPHGATVDWDYKGWDAVKNTVNHINQDIVGAFTGAFKMLDTAVDLVSPFSTPSEDREALKKAGGMAKNMVVAPVNALRGRPQPGQSQSSAPTSLPERIPAAVDLFLGGDPGAGKERFKEGDYLGAASAYVTGPLVAHGVSELLPKGSSKGELREPVPRDAWSPTREAAARVSNPGNYLPNDPATVSNLASAFEPAPKGEVANAVLIRDLLPDLRQTAKEKNITTKGIVATEDAGGSITKPVGKGVKPEETLGYLMTATMKRLQEQFDGLLKPNKDVSVGTTPIAERLERLKTEGVNAASGKSQVMNAASADEFTALRNKIDAAKEMFEGHDYTLQQLDDLRKYYFSTSRAGAAGRIAQRSSHDIMIDTAIEEGLRDLEYDKLNQIARPPSTGAVLPPDFINQLKNKQQKLYKLTDRNAPMANDFIDRDAVQRGYSLVQQIAGKMSGAVHPETGHVVSSLHGIPQALSGNPKSLESMNGRIQQSFARKGIPADKLDKAVQVGGKVVKTGALGQLPDKAKRTPPPTTVKMKAPDGSVNTVPSDQVEHWKSKGATVVN